MSSRHILQIAVWFLGTAVAYNAQAVPFANGDFSAGLTGWNIDGDVSVVSEAAQLDTGPGAAPFSAVLTQGDDGTFTFPTPLTLGPDDNFLIFDVSFSDLGVDGSEVAPFFANDNLAVSVFDALDPALDLLFGSVADLTTGVQQIVLDVSSLASRDVALAFELNDENDGRDSRATIDNVAFSNSTPTSVPEPASAILLALGLALMGRRKPGETHIGTY